MNTPARDPSDLGIAHSAEAALFHPEKAKSFSAPERVQHVKTFPIFEIGFILWVVRVGFASDFYVSFDGCAAGVVQPSLARLPLVIISFPEETPVTPPITPIVFLFEPGRGLFRVPSPCPPPQLMEDRIINVCKGTFADCTIRTWSRRTLRWMVGQSMAYHSAASLEIAPTAVAVVICLTS